MTIIQRITASAAALLIVIAANAADYAGWTVYPTFAAGKKLIVDTGSRVYFANTGLFSYDKDSKEQTDYASRLNGTDIERLHYNDKGGYLLVAYSDADIDLVYDDGRVVNMPQIAISEQTPATINDVAFNGRDIYVATSFGIVRFDEATHEVRESGIYGKDIHGLAVAAGHLLARFEGYVYHIPLDRPINSFDNFERIFFSGTSLEVHPLSDTKLLIRTLNRGEYALCVWTVDIPQNLVHRQETVSTELVPPFLHTRGNISAIVDGYICTFGADGTMTRVAPLPDAYATDAIDSATTPDNLWCINEQGLTNISIASPATTVLADRFLPDAVYTREVDFFAPSADGRSLYIYNYGASAYKPYSTTNESPITVTRLDLRTGATDYATPYPVDAVNPVAQGFQTHGGRYPLNPSMIAPDPDDPDTYWIATGNDGVYKITDGKLAGVFNSSNSYIRNVWGDNAFAVHIDRGGNLWTVGYRGNGSSVAVLPAAMRKRPVSEVKKTDWIELDDDGFNAASDVAFLECRTSGMIFITSHSETFQLLAYDTGGTYSNFADDKSLLWTSMTDQDGKTWTPERKICLTEDANGRVWFGTNQGIYQITNPKQATNTSMRFQKTKVPRNDGTNEADYLLDNDMVYAITVDSRNRKWIASENSGLVCVSETGNAIFQTYNIENSPLASSSVLSVWVDKATDRVYVGTIDGLLTLDAANESAADTYDDILAYPNPVRPEHTGPVYIRGLMENSLVKIADAAGRVVAQGRAENGTFRWDACDHSGQRVKTGVYYVFASQNTDGSSAATTKILVVN